MRAKHLYTLTMLSIIGTIRNYFVIKILLQKLLYIHLQYLETFLNYHLLISSVSTFRLTVEPLVLFSLSILYSSESRYAEPLGNCPSI